MKRSIICIVAILSACFANASEPQKGYRGFLEWDNSITSYNFNAVGSETVWFTGLSTSHGYQFSPNLYVGAGLALNRSTNSDWDQWFFPLFAHVRTDQNWNGFTPFGDLRLGYNFTDGGGVYFSPSIGYRFSISKKMNFNIGIGMTVRGYAVDKYDIYYDQGHDYGDSYLQMTYIGKSHRTKAYFTFRLGVDF